MQGRAEEQMAGFTGKEEVAAKRCEEFYPEAIQAAEGWKVKRDGSSIQFGETKVNEEIERQ